MKFPAYVIVVLNLVFALVVNSVALAKGRPRWVGTWATPPVAQPAVAQPPGLTSPAAFNNQTLRLIAHTSIGGHAVRVRLSNAFGTQRLAIGAAHIALRNNGAAIVPASDRTLTFGGAK